MEEMVSIIVPVYRAADYIAETIAMVEKQTYTNWELILVDDASPDNSVEIIERVAAGSSAMFSEQIYADGQGERNIQEEGVGQTSRIRLICKEKNEGAARARNSGLDAAKGRYIAFLDADDIWFPQKLEKELAFMKENNAAFAFTAYEFGDENAKGTGKVVTVPERLTYKKALSRTVIFTTTVMFDTEQIPKELLRMPVVESEDTATWWQILRAGYTAYGLNEVLAVYRRPQTSLSSNKFTAMKRIWNLYRREEKLSLPVSVMCFFAWAVRATLRRI
ncbi:MAG: glycosyltransferase [Ruminococcus sp.]|nr:glycosyltransferase [Ruminococcus sp.]